jgi:hypothetical protein
MDDSSETPVAEEKYNTAEIRNLIKAAFGDGEFNAFCFDNFPAVYEHFSDGMSRLVKIHFLIEYNYRQGRVEELLNLIQIHNPYQYQIYESHI